MNLTGVDPACKIKLEPGLEHQLMLINFRMEATSALDVESERVMYDLIGPLGP